ncbi:MAG: GNAT family N-acetyltransferase [Erysipelotrichaceae bacterium]
MFRKSKPLLSDGEIQLRLVRKVVDPDPAGWGTSYIYDIEAKHTIVGRCDLRIGDTFTLDLAGHIGYAVYLPYRGHHYAAKATLLLFQQAKHLGMSQLIITCNPDNIASFKTCELVGCTYVCNKPVPPLHDLYKQGDREKAIFIKDLSV